MRFKPVNFGKRNPPIAVADPRFAFQFSPSPISKSFIEPLTDMYTGPTSNPFVIGEFANDFKVTPRHQYDFSVELCMLLQFNYDCNIEYKAVQANDLGIGIRRDYFCAITPKACGLRSMR